MKHSLKLFFFWSCLFLLFFHDCYSDEWKRIYLASFPRSGNHWLRQLIEEVTNVATSSVYIDHDEDQKHLPTPFPWGGYCVSRGYTGDRKYPQEGDIVFIKTHYPGFLKVPFDLQPSIKTIRVIRNPVDTFWSYHVFTGVGSDRIPEDFLSKLLYHWRVFQEYWDKQDNVITIRYEDLYNDTFSSLKRVLTEIGYKAEDIHIQRAIAKYPRQGTLYKHAQTIDKEDLKRIEDELNDLIIKYHYPLYSRSQFIRNYLIKDKL